MRKTCRMPGRPDVDVVVEAPVVVTGEAAVVVAECVAPEEQAAVSTETAPTRTAATLVRVGHRRGRWVRGGRGKVAMLCVLSEPGLPVARPGTGRVVADLRAASRPPTARSSSALALCRGTGTLGLSPSSRRHHMKIVVDYDECASNAVCMGIAPEAFEGRDAGYFHVGSARTALFNWLVARQSGGTFVLRIEDTDAERNREEWVDGIFSAMHWLSMDPDEGPYRQSLRTERYHQAIDALWDAGCFYACGCTHDEVDARNRAAGILTPGYDGFCRSRGLPRGEGTALRFRMPDEGITTVRDVIRGAVEFPCSAMDDFVAVKANGAPLFVLANVVDDIDMAITHVIRGEDLLPTTPKGILLWEALISLGWTTDGSAGAAGAPAPGLPVFAHLPMLVNEQRKKLSKRRDPVAVESYRDQGYLPEAFVNYLGLLGWSPPGEDEIFTVDQMAEWFRLEDVNHSPAFFDVAKLTHMNGEYIRAMPLDTFIEACRPW